MIKLLLKLLFIIQIRLMSTLASSPQILLTADSEMESKQFFKIPVSSLKREFEGEKVPEKYEEKWKINAEQAITENLGKINERFKTAKLFKKNDWENWQKNSHHFQRDFGNLVEIEWDRSKRRSPSPPRCVNLFDFIEMTISLSLRIINLKVNLPKADFIHVNLPAAPYLSLKVPLPEQQQQQGSTADCSEEIERIAKTIRITSHLRTSQTIIEEMGENGNEFGEWEHLLRSMLAQLENETGHHGNLLKFYYKLFNKLIDMLKLKIDSKKSNAIQKRGIRFRPRIEIDENRNRDSKISGLSRPRSLSTQIYKEEMTKDETMKLNSIISWLQLVVQKLE